MTIRRWARLWAVTALAVGATLAATAGPAEALPRRCNYLLDMIDHDWERYDFYVNEANINRHDANYSDFVENMNMAAGWAQQAKMDTTLAQNAHCY